MPLPRKIDWESQIGRRLRLSDLHVFFAVVERGSMAKAAGQLGVSQPAVSEVIANLEHALRVPLLDRSPRGVEPTVYGRALLKRGIAAFDELKQGVRDIEFLADPTVGELRIGAVESIVVAILPPVVQRFTRQYPGVVLHVEDVITPTLELPKLHDRSLDLVLARLVRPLVDEGDDLSVEVLFDNALVIAAGVQSRWARRRKIDLADLLEEQWILTPPKTWNYERMVEAFRARGLDMPRARLQTFSVHLRANLLATGEFVTAIPASVLHLYGSRFALKALPIDLPVRPWPVAIVTLKNRTLSPIVDLFTKHLRDYTRSMTNAKSGVR